MKNNFYYLKIFIVWLLVFSFILPFIVKADDLKNIDSDSDGISDYDEINVYYTDPYNKDTDGDAYTDWQELNSAYSPHNPEKVKLKDNDQDGDGLSDFWELRFKTNLLDSDTDGDTYSDGEEIKNYYNPLSVKLKKLEKKIDVDLVNQKLHYYLGGVRLDTFLVSSGINNSTPRGSFTITGKHLKAWSPYGLWMPYWMALGSGKYGLHELPVWPSGYREGEDHLGTPASHGCIRLGTEKAEVLYNFADVGTSVFIY